MILSEIIIVETFRNKKLKWYQSLGYDIEKEKIEVKVKDLPLSVSNLVLVKCDYCGKKHERKFVDYNRIVDKISGKWACSRKCGTLKFKGTIDNTQRPPHPMKGNKIDSKKLEDILEKRKQTNLEKWGVEHALQNLEIKEKFQKTHLEKWGVINFSQTSEFKLKQKQKCIQNWGVDHHSKSDIIKEKIRKTNLEKWGVVSTLNINLSNANRLKVFESEEFRKNYEISNHSNYIKYIGSGISLFRCQNGHNFEIKYDNFKTRLLSNLPICTICYPISDLSSIKENELFQFIRSIYNGNIIESFRDVLEIDIYLPDLKIGFEFNGLYWHSDKFKEKNYHLDKTNYFKEKGIKIIHIWEDDWDHRRDIIKSQIKNILGLNRTIFARKCEVREIKDSKISGNFLLENHIQGKVNSKIKIGLFHNDELVSIMTFDQFEGRKKMPQSEWNLNRFCNKLGFNVIGGASKMITYFIRNYKPKRIISYADKDWSVGNLYYKLGFNLTDETKPDYRYLINDELIHKSRFRKSNIGISESKLDIPKVWNCGKMKFEYIIKKNVLT
jgi:hypothetical protein